MIIQIRRCLHGYWFNRYKQLLSETGRCLDLASVELSRTLGAYLGYAVQLVLGRLASTSYRIRKFLSESAHEQ